MHSRMCFSPISAFVADIHRGTNIKKKDAKIKFPEEGIFQRFLIIDNNFV